MTRIAKGKQTGELWDRVKLENGIVGYVFQNYVEEVKEIEVKQINLSLENTTLQKGERVELKVQVLPEDATNKSLSFTSSNPSVVSVDSTGKLLAVSSGTATITAKSINNIACSITVRVYSRVTGISLKEENLTLQEGEIYAVVPIISPSDANNPKVVFSSSDTNIAEIDENGNVNAKMQGECKVKASTQEGNYEKEFTLTVIPKLEEDAISFSKDLTVNGNQITGWGVKTSVSEVFEKITSSYEIRIKNYKGEELEQKDFIGTESKIQILDGDKVIIEYHIILYGDVNGDGNISTVDLLVLQRHILELKELTGLFLKAGNIDKTGKNPSSVDLLKIQRHILGLKEIEQ